MTCADIMSPNPSCCTADDPALRAAELMKSEDIGSVPVVASNSDRRVIGIVTDRDLTLRLLAEGRAPEATSTSEVMTRNPVICHAGDDIYDAMRTMSRNQIRRIPIVDDRGQLCGIVAQADIARHLDEREAGEVLEDISQPGHNAIGRAFQRARAIVRTSDTQAYGANWLAAAGIGAAIGAGLMALIDQRRSAPYRAGRGRQTPTPV